VLIASQPCRELRPHFRGEASVPVAAEARTKEEYTVHRVLFPPRLVAGEQLRRRSPAWLFLEIDVGERLAVVIADDKRRANVLDGRKAVWNAIASRFETQ
jgi:hypothetical protein